METLIELKQKRASAIEAQGKIITTAKSAEDGMTEEEVRNFDALDQQIADLDAKIERAEKVEAAEKRNAELQRKKNPSLGAIGKQKEQENMRSYSLLEVMKVETSKNRSLEGFQLEMHQEAEKEARDAGQTINGVGIPNAVAVAMLHGEKRDMTAGTNADGGFFVPDEVSTSIITALRPRLVTAAAGARTLGNLTGDFSIPKNGGVSVGWASETGAATESTPTIGQVALSPKRITATTDVSRQLIKQSSADVEMMLRDDFFGAVAAGIDAAALYGGGTNEPTGVLATSGIGAAYAGGATTSGANPNGAALVYKDFTHLEAAVGNANGDGAEMSFIMNPTVRGAARGTETSSGSGRFIMEGPNDVAGYRAFTTTNIPNNLSKGSSSEILSALLFGDFRQLMIAQWGGLDLIVNPYSKDTQGLVGMTVHQFVDVGVRRAEAFAAILDILNS